MNENEIIERLKRGEKMLINKCSNCDYLCGYIHRPDAGFLYDAGCWCAMKMPEPRSVEDLRRTIEQNPNFEWKFI